MSDFGQGAGSNFPNPNFPGGTSGRSNPSDPFSGSRIIETGTFKSDVTITQTWTTASAGHDGKPSTQTVVIKKVRSWDYDYVEILCFFAGAVAIVFAVSMAASWMPINAMTISVAALTAIAGALGLGKARTRKRKTTTG